MSEVQRTVWIARHGEREDFVDPRWSETAAEPGNPPLSAGGRQQAQDLARRLAGEPIAHIFSSPFRRTLETAAPTAVLLGLPIKVEHGACEMLAANWFPADPRIWTLAQLAAEFPIDSSYVTAVNPSYPEDWEQCKVRAAQTTRYLTKHFSGDLLILGHGASVNSMSWGLVDGYPQAAGHCCALVRLDQQRDGTWQMTLAGDTSHLTYHEPEVRFV